MSKLYPNNQFLPLTNSSLEQVLAWRNSARIRANMHNNALITWEEHTKWFASFNEDTSREFWVLHQNNRPIGVLNFDGVGNAKVEWGCYLGETNVWPGSGLLLEVAALDRAATLSNAEFLIAEVLSFNKSAIGMHKLFDYPLVETKEAGRRNGESFQTLCYEYPLIQWQQRKADTLLKLPKALRTLCETIEFRE